MISKKPSFSHTDEEDISMRKLLLRRATDEGKHMADSPPYPGTSRWVKVFGIIVIVLVLLFVIMMLLPGGHGPGRHTPSGEHTPSGGGH